MHDHIPRMTVALGIVRDGLVLTGQVRGARDELQTWLPTAQLQMGETLEQCAVRCAQEYAGLEVIGIQRGPLQIEDGQRTQFVWAHARGGEILAAPGFAWSWQRWATLPQPLHPALATLQASGQVPSGALWGK